MARFGSSIFDGGIFDIVNEWSMSTEDALALTEEFGFSVITGLGSEFSIEEQTEFEVKRAALSEVITEDDQRFYVKAQKGSEVSTKEDIRFAVASKLQEGIGITENIELEKYQAFSQVFIGGYAINTSGISVKHVASDRVSTCSFTLYDPSEEIVELCKQRAEVHIYLSDGEGNGEFFGGRIKENPIDNDTPTTAKLEITVYDYTDAAYDVRVSEIYTEAEGTLTDILLKIWGKYKPFTIDLSKVVPTDKKVPYLAFKYDTLFDTTEMVAQLLGWTWYIEWDGQHRILKFFPPEGAIKPVVLSRENGNVIAGTARFGQDDKIINRLYVFGGTTLSQDYTQRIIANGTDTIYNLHHKPYAPTNQSMVVVKLNDTPKIVDFDFPYWPEGKEVLVNVQGRFIKWPEENKPPQGAIIDVVYRYQYPVGILLEDQESIAKYGVIEDVITDSKISDSTQAREIAKQTLKERAFPKGYGSMEITEPGLRAGDFITVDMPHLGTTGLFEIVEIEKKAEGNVLRRAVNLNITDNPETRIAQRLKDFSKRLASLELKDIDENAAIQKIQSVYDELNITSKATIKGEIDLTDLADRATVGDSAKFETKIKKADTVEISSSCGATLWDGKFGIGTFDSSRFGWGVIS